MLMSGLILSAQKSIGEIKDADELTLNVKKLKQTYVQNNFALWTNLLSDNAVIYLNNSKVDKIAVINGFKFHHTIFNDIQIPNIIAQTNYAKNGAIWITNWFNWQGTGNKIGIRYSNNSNFNFKWKDGKIIELVCIYHSASLKMELNAK
ncbi:MAG: hypothetical protein ACI9FW_001033 [Flavobacterium sp.]|jgi:hypothetical protein